MEVEEETTSNHLEESIAAETTNVINESLLENANTSDKEFEKELSKLIPNSNTKSEDSDDFVSVAVGALVEEEKGEEIVVHCRSSESAAALSGGIESSVVVESVNMVEDLKDGNEGAVKENDVPSDDVTAVECGGSELACSVDIGGGKGEEVVVDRNGDLEMVEEKVENNGEDTYVLLPVARNGEGDEVKDEFRNEVGVNVQLEDVENGKEMVGSDVTKDGGDVQVKNIDNVQGDEAMTEERVVAEVVKEEGMVEDEEEATGVREDFKEEALRANEETVDGVAENDENVTMVVDKEKFLDTELETERTDTELETEKSLDIEMETEKSLDTEMETEEEANLADEEKVHEAEIESEPELPESSKTGSGGKRKRGGKISKVTPKSPAAPRKTAEEDVCFICFDGGDLVLCDRRNCPKAYHPSCVNRDEAFFQSKGRWNCGWHLCSICEKKAEYMCYTCTYSLCKACIKTSIILCVREKEKKGLCEACMKTVMLIEKQENQGNINFDDKNSWEHLFKDYWTETKAKHNLSLAELSQAKNPWKGSGKQESPIAQSDFKDDGGFGSDNPPENLKVRKSIRKTKKQKPAAKEEDFSAGEGSVPENTEWVSKELLEFVMHMKNGDSSVLSQFEVQDLLLEYIKRNKLRDPNRKSQIICDARLETLFGKPRVAHIEMLKLLESHFLMKEDFQIDDTEVSQVDDDENNETLTKDHKDRKRRGRKKGDRRGPQSNREDYAAIDIHNISMIYLRRKLVEDLLDDMESFHEKIVGTFVRIRISGANQKQDIYRLVQVTGTSEAAQYTIGKRTTSTMLEILNLDKTETIPIDTISNQEFMEDECKRLRQSIKCGLLSRLTVGDILDKAMELQVARVNDLLETEVVRLNHLRDRASDLGRKKELRECVEKLNVLKTPEERARRLDEFPLIHVDPTMDPDYESEDDTGSDDKKQELYKRFDSFRFNNRGRDQFSPRKDYTSKESWNPPKNYEFTRNLSNKNFSSKVENAPTSSFQIQTETSRDQQKDTFAHPITSEKPPSPKQSAPKLNESEKMWHYKDPSGKIQGPFSMLQLRKWSKNGYFPVGLKIWQKSDKEHDGILLTDALEGKLTLVDQRRPSEDGQNLNSNHEFANLPSPTPDKSSTGWTGGQANPHAGPMAGSSVPSLVACGNKEVSSVEPVGGSTITAAPHSSEQGSQLGQMVAPPDGNMAVQMVQSVSSQGWSSDPNPSMNMAGVQQYNQWTGVPTMVQNPVGSFIPQEPWGQLPFPVNQPNVNWAANPNMGWVPGNPMNWGPMVQGPQVTGNVNPTWVMQPGWVPPPPVQGVLPNQNWVAGNGNLNPSWVGPPGGPNGGWGAPSADQGPANANSNTGWVNQGAPVVNQGPGSNMGWVQPPVNQGPPPPQPPAGNNNNQNWNHRGGYRRNRGGSGFRGNNNRRHFNKQESFHGGDH